MTGTTSDTRNWQVSISNPTARVEGAEDIAQCIYIILNTIPGSDPLRPAFGSGIYRYIDAPTNKVEPRLVYEAITAIERWEPRVTVTRCRLVGNGPAGRSLQIEATAIASAAQMTISVKI